MKPLSEATAQERLRWLAANWVPPTRAEVLRAMTPAPFTADPSTRAQESLDELHALMELTAALQEAQGCRPPRA